VVAILTDSVEPNAYWRKLKQRLKEEGNETVTKCHGLKMFAQDGKMQIIDVADTELGHNYLLIAYPATVSIYSGNRKNFSLCKS
jgi:hypothetical protein